MFANGFRDLVKPQWVKLMDELKCSGGLTVPELQQRIGGSYMGVKDQCEALKNRGYLEKWRRPPKEVGRPEIAYRLTQKANGAMADVGADVLLEMLESTRQMFGESAPERILLHYFQELGDRWRARVSKAKSLIEKATILTSLRQEIGCYGQCQFDSEAGFRIEEYHHPLRPVFEAYPNAKQFELRVMEELLGTKVERREVKASRHGVARVEYQIATLGVESGVNAEKVKS